MASIFGKMKSLFGSSSSASVVGVDIGSSSIKIVQVRESKGKAILETYGEIALGPYKKEEVGRSVKLAEDEVAHALSDLIKEANVTASDAGVAIPFSASLVNIINMPDVSDAQLKRMIPIEARKYIPVPASEVTLDWFVLPQEERPDAFDRVAEQDGIEKKGKEVLLAAIHNETLRMSQAVVKAANLAVSFFEIEIFSVVRSVLGHGIAPVVIIDIGATTTKMYVVERGIVRTSHLLNLGSQAISDRIARTMSWTFEKAERTKREWGLTGSSAYSQEENETMREAMLSTLNRIFSEANRVSLDYGKRYNKNISHVVFTGGGSSLLGLAEIAHDALKLDVQVAHPFEKVESPAFLDEVLRTIGPGFAVAVGAALRRLREGQ